jgi:hypothetical protein
VSNFGQLGDVKIARETYVYEAALGDWMAHMEALGCVREPDERRTLTLPWSGEEVLSQAKK